MSPPLAPGASPLRERLTLAEEWQRFEKLCIPAEALAGQRIEMRRGWYAGAIAMLALASSGFDVGSEPTDLDVAYLESLYQELRTYAADLAAGKA